MAEECPKSSAETDLCTMVSRITSGTELWELLSTQPYDTVLLDHQIECSACSAHLDAVHRDHFNSLPVERQTFLLEGATRMINRFERRRAS